jgi:hypothetical protein
MRHPGLEMLEHGLLDTEIAIARAIEHVAAALAEPETPEENGAGIARSYTLLRP